MSQNSKFKIIRKYNNNLWGNIVLHKLQKKTWKNVVKRSTFVPIKQKMLKDTSFLMKKQRDRYQLRRIYKQGLLTKQRLKTFYGDLSEKDFKKLYKMSSRGSSLYKFENFVSILERRLPIVLFRMGFFVNTIEANQYIVHGAIRVNGKVITNKNFLIRNGDVVSIDKKFFKQILRKIHFNFMRKQAFIGLPEYIEVNYKILAGIFLRSPKIAEVPYFIQMDLHLLERFLR